MMAVGDAGLEADAHPRREHGLAVADLPQRKIDAIAPGQQGAPLHAQVVEGIGTPKELPRK